MDNGAARKVAAATPEATGAKQDLRTFVEALRAAYPDEVVEVDRPVSTRYEVAAVIARGYKEGRTPVIIFNNIIGHPDYSIITNTCADPRKTAFALGTAFKNYAEEYARRLDHPRPVRRLSTGPVKEIIQKGDEVDLTRLPVVIHSEKDDAPYITMGVTICKDPDTQKYNLGIYRHRLNGPRELGLYYSWGKRIHYIHDKMEAQNKPLEVAIAIGVHPLIYYGSIAGDANPNVDEYELVGGLFEEGVEVVPCETVDLYVPAYAEIVIEGLLLPGERRTEGPFGEYTGYYGQVVDAPVVQVTAVTQRRRAMYYDIGMNVEHCYMTNAPREAQLLRELRKVCPGVTAVHIPASGTCLHGYIQMRKRTEGDAKNVLMVALGLDRFLKHVVVVDDDIDIYNEQEVLWAIATRVRADRDIFIVEGARGNRLDPMTYTITRLERDGMVTKMGIDATTPMGLPYELPERMVIPGVESINLSDYFNK